VFQEDGIGLVPTMVLELNQMELQPQLVQLVQLAT